MGAGASLIKFEEAIKRGDSTAIQSSLSRGLIDAANARLGAVDTPALVLAAQYGHAATVEVLLNAGARIDDSDTGGRTACLAAVENGRDEVLALLISRKANLGVKCRGQTLLDFALQYDNVRVIAMLLEAGAPLNSLQRRDLVTLAATSTAIIVALENRGVVINELRDDDDGRTPLHIACGSHSPDRSVVNMLAYRCDIDLNVRDSVGNTPCHIAARGNVELLRWFVEAGADIECVNSDGFTPLLVACHRGWDNCVVVLLAAGANAQAMSSDGTSACGWAVRQCHAEWFMAEIATAIVYALLAVDSELEVSVVQAMWTARGLKFGNDAANVDIARRRIAAKRLAFVRKRALQVCIGLQPLGLDALQTCEILMHACGRVAPLISFHHWWKIATTVKHFVGQ